MNYCLSYLLYLKKKKKNIYIILLLYYQSHSIKDHIYSDIVFLFLLLMNCPAVIRWHFLILDQDDTDELNQCHEMFIISCLWNCHQYLTDWLVQLNSGAIRPRGLLLWYNCTFKKQCTVPVTLTIDLFFQWIEYHPISILYTFQIDISSNSREIKYQNIEK